MFNSKNQVILSILNNLQEKNFPNSNTKNRNLADYFFSETNFNLIKMVFTDTEIKTLEKGLDFAPIKSKI